LLKLANELAEEKRGLVAKLSTNEERLREAERLLSRLQELTHRECCPMPRDTAQPYSHVTLCQQARAFLSCSEPPEPEERRYTLAEVEAAARAALAEPTEGD
jgi:hypothetical protein